MTEKMSIVPAPEAEHQHPIPPRPSIKEKAARMASTTEETARYFAGPTKDLRLKLVLEEEGG